MSAEVKGTFQVVRPAVGKLPALYKCDYPNCNTRDNLRRISEHVQNFHLKRTLSCNVCKKTYVRMDALKRHRNYDGADRSGTCRICVICRYKHKSGEERAKYEAECQGEGDCQKRVLEAIRKLSIPSNSAAADTLRPQ